MNIEPTRFLPVKGKPLSPFISKLKALLSDERFRRAIKWCENGCAIVISDGETFKKLVLDRSEEMKMFKTRNFTSFVRQLNLYGFKKVPVNGKGDPSKNMKFEHQNFRRENPELMHLVHRTCPTRKNKKVNRTGKTKFTKRTAALHSARKSRFKCYSDECVGPDGESDSENSSMTSSDSRTTTPSKSNFADTSAYEQAPHDPLEASALEQYMYQKIQEEHMVVQLLLSLKNTVPRPMASTNGEFQPEGQLYSAPCQYYIPALPPNTPSPNTPYYY